MSKRQLATAGGFPSHMKRLGAPTGAPGHLVKQHGGPPQKISGPMPGGFDQARCAGKMKSSIAQGSKKGPGANQ